MVNTSRGIIRNYNEDRVAIILNIMKPDDKDCKYWPNCSFFGVRKQFFQSAKPNLLFIIPLTNSLISFPYKIVLQVYDGHGGSACADFLRDNLHKFVINDGNFPENPTKALINGFSQAEKVFCHYAMEEDRYEASGSCAAVLLYVDDICYVANVGDSRSILSCDHGERYEQLSMDHKPDDHKEKMRILSAGGKIYKSPNQDVSLIYPQIFREQYVVEGPWRIMPGKLSVARSLGDICAKFPKFGGNPDVLLAVPEIKRIKVEPNMDWMLVACDGIFDAFSTSELIEFSWEKIEEKIDEDVHSLGGRLINDILTESMLRRSLDNITAILICFENMETFVKGRLQKMGTGKVGGSRAGERDGGLFDEKNKHIFRTAPDRTSLRLATK